MTQRPLRLLLVHTGADLYGASRSFLRLSTRLVADGHIVLAVLPYDGPLLQQLRNAGVNVRLHSGMPLLSRATFAHKFRLLRWLMSLPVSVGRLIRIIRQFRPDLVHTNTTLTPCSAVAARLCGIPHLWHVRESFTDFPAIWKLYQWLIFKFTDRIACVSAAMAAQFSGKYRNKTLVLHNGFPKSEFEGITPEAVSAFRARFGLQGRQAVGLVGRIKFVRKGQEVFVAAAAKIKQQFPDARFLCIGSPFPGNEDHLRRLQDLVRELSLGDQFIYTGDVEDIKAAYGALDVSVSAAAQPEPFAGVVVESMAMGIPVVGTAVGGTAEQIEDGVTGFLVPAGDVDSMAAALAKLLASPQLRSEFGKAARERFLSHFEFEPFYAKIVSIYRSLIDSRPHS